MKKILVVDDQESIRDLVSATLEDERYAIYTAADGEEALRLSFKVHPDVILLDIAMPGMNGFEVCRALKSNPLTSSIHVIMLTGHDQAEDRLKGNEAGADDYFTKPFSPLTLIKKIEEVLG